MLKKHTKPLGAANRVTFSVDSESCFTIFLARILRKMRLASRKNIIASLVRLTRREKCDIVKLASPPIARHANQQNHHS